MTRAMTSNRIAGLAIASMLAALALSAPAHAYDSNGLTPTYDANHHLLPVCDDKAYALLQEQVRDLNHTANATNAAADIHAAYVKALEFSECGDERSAIFNAQFNALHSWRE